MTVICGLVDFDDLGDLTHDCRLMLAALAPYSHVTGKVSAIPGAAFATDASERESPRGETRHLVVADCRIDNRDELRGVVGAAASTDEATILRSLVSLEGKEGFSRLIGDFAIAWYDGPSRKLILARNVTGQRALFVAHRGAKIAFASMPVGILAVPGFWRGFDRIALADMLRGRPPRDGATGFAGVTRAPPGRVTTMSMHGDASQPIWEPSFAPLQLGEPQAYAEAYRALLDEAVLCRVRHAVAPIGAFLSSGFDSSAVAATAARQMVGAGPIVAVTAAPPLGFAARPAPRGRLLDESDLAARTARMHGMSHLVVRTSASLADRLRVQAKLFQDPLRNHINTGWMHDCTIAAKSAGATTVLTGELGNLTINAGGLELLCDIRRRSGMAAWAGEALATKRKQDVRWRGILYNSFATSLPFAADRALLSMFQDVRAQSRTSFLREEWKLGQDETAGPQGAERLSGDSYVDRWRHIQSLDYGNHRKGTLAETGVELLDPTADRRLIDFSLRVPRDQYLKQGVSRPMAKAALGDRVPQEILQSKLRGGQSADWHEQLARATISDLIDEIATNSIVCSLIDIDRMRRAVDHWPAFDDERFPTYERYANHLLLALAVGLFVVAFDRPLHD